MTFEALPDGDTWSVVNRATRAVVEEGLSAPDAMIHAALRNARAIGEYLSMPQAVRRVGPLAQPMPQRAADRWPVEMREPFQHCGVGPSVYPEGLCKHGREWCEACEEKR